MEVSPYRNNFLFYDPESAKKNAGEIFNGSHWNAEDTPEQKKENAGRIHKSGITISEGQGSLLLRKKLWKVIEGSGSFLSFLPEVIRASRDQNPKLFTILQCKRLAHALNLEGQVMMADESLLDLISFNETFTIPMLGSSLWKWATTKNPESQEKTQGIITILKNALCYDNLDDKKIEKALEDLAKGLPLLICSGWDWHSTGIILIQGEDEEHNYLINSNRGDDYASGGAVSGWNVYKIGKIDASFIKTLASRIAHTKSEYLSCQKLVDEYSAKPIYQYRMKGQKVGNCTYTSLKAGIFALMKISLKSNGFKERVSDELFLKIGKDEGDDFYKSFSSRDKQFVLEDFLIDLKENREAKHIQPLAEKIHKKLINSPTLGFKLGWKLWLEAIELCQKSFPTLESLSPHLREQVTQFIVEDVDSPLEKKPSADRLVKLMESFLREPVDKKEKSFSPEVRDRIYNLIEGVIHLGNGEIMHQWMADSEIKEPLGKVFNLVFKNLCTKNEHYEAVKQLLPFLSKDALNSFEMETFCTNLIHANHVKEVMEIADNLDKLKEDVIRKVARWHIQKKSWKEAHAAIQKIEKNSLSKKALLLELCRALTEGHLWDEAKEIVYSLKKLHDRVCYAQALNNIALKQIKSKMWKEVKVLIDELKELKSECFTLSFTLSVYSKALSKEGRFQEAMEVAASIEKDSEEKSSALKELSSHLKSAGEIDKAEEIQALSSEMEKRIENARLKDFLLI